MTDLWLFGKRTDLLLLFIPVWLLWAVSFSLPADIIAQPIPIWVWATFILGFDVTHVWSTLFRTYTDKQEFQSHKTLLIWSPIIAFSVAFGIALFSGFWFWRIMAYLALFHFIKQQYGFFMLYKVKSKAFKRLPIVSDKFAIYFTMLFPVVYWHLSQDLEIAWIIDNDFLPIGKWIGWSFDKNLPIKWITSGLYFSVLITWVVQDIFTYKTFHWGKLLWLTTTAGNWYIGIVLFNSDLIFSVTNVVAHGLPYVVLIIVYRTRKDQLLSQVNSLKRQLLTAGTILILIALLALTEEYFWDIWINRSKYDFFGSFMFYPDTGLQGSVLRSLTVAFLSVPQISHYIIDGYIWKNNSKNPHLVPILFDHESKEIHKD